MLRSLMIFLWFYDKMFVQKRDYNVCDYFTYQAQQEGFEIMKNITFDILYLLQLLILPF